MERFATNRGLCFYSTKFILKRVHSVALALSHSIATNSNYRLITRVFFKCEAGLGRCGCGEADSLAMIFYYDKS